MLNGSIYQRYAAFTIVEDRGFRNFVQMLNPSYQLPSRKYLSSTLLPAMYEEKYTEVENLIKNLQQNVTLTTDSWTSRNAESFIAVTTHFVSEDFRAKSVLLECCSFPVQHTSANLATELNRVVTTWGLESKILLPISDNAPNITKAIKEDLAWKHFGCYAHTINLIIQDGLKIVSPVVTKIRTLVAHFKRSTNACYKLIEVQRQVGKNPKKLIQDVTTRWNSTFYMLDRVLELEYEVRTTMALLNVNNLPIISIGEWQLLQQLRMCLKPMEEVTKIISGEKYVTLSSVIILTKGLENIYINMKNEDLLPLIQSLVEQVLKGLSDRLGDLENSQTLLVSSFIDPRFKNVGFTSDHVAERAKQLVIKLVTRKISQSASKSKETKQFLSTSTDDNTENRSAGQPSVWGHFEKKAATFSSKTIVPATSRAIIEVQRYLEEDLADRNEDPLQWWRDHSYNYPHLSKVVIEKFGTVATSVPCERIFSKSGQLISERRSRLSVNKVEKLMFLNANSEL
ncbi:E3 SUMO-protein ligase ZBED1-like [Diabrotica undecimpunctata]|uniref:E3 SUMO-protein ligase ZBED1-like n=1 Tax=Diabrotica undecimpunctata TaxID=50387 RepID=UPI003B63C42F